jgi:hypothetical protein
VLKTPGSRNYCRIIRAISAKYTLDDMRKIATVSKIASFIDCSSMHAPRSFAVRHNGRAEKEHHTEAESVSNMPRLRSSASILKRSSPLKNVRNIRVCLHRLDTIRYDKTDDIWMMTRT